VTALSIRRHAEDSAPRCGLRHADISREHERVVLESVPVYRKDALANGWAINLGELAGRRGLAPMRLVRRGSCGPLSRASR
jgi:hypothetical protein